MRAQDDGPALVRLDPRLADGRAPARALAELPTRWTTRASFAAGAPADWTVRHAAIEARDDGIWLRGNALDATRQRAARVELLSATPIDASEVNRVEVELSVVDGTQARLAWLPAGVAAPPRGWTEELTVYLEPEGDRMVARFALDDAPGWKGSIERLHLLPVHQGLQQFTLHELRLGFAPFAWGSEPSTDQGDAGLVGCGVELRRAWPSDFDVPLFARCVAPSGARLELDCGVAADVAARASWATFVADVRADGGAWERAGLLPWTPGASACDWKRWTVDLARFEGRSIEIRLVATRAGALFDPLDPPRGALERASVRFGCPQVVRALSSRGDRPPNVLLVTLDTTRADALGAYASLRRAGELEASVTPALDRLASEGVVFDSAWTACNSTSPAHASLFTGLPVREHGLISNLGRLGGEHATLAERLRDAGYHTAAAVSVGHLRASFSGLGQGFDQYLDADPRAVEDGRRTLEPVLAWLEGWPASDRPFFLWTHLFDAHQYKPPEEFLRAYAARYGLEVPPRRVEPPTVPIALTRRADYPFGDVDNAAYLRFVYRASVAYLDTLFERLREELERDGVWDRTIVVVVADHGEAHAEREAIFGHDLLIEPIVRVPLIVRLPDRWNPSRAAGVRVADNVSSIDLLPSLLELVDLPASPTARGRSWTELVAGARWADRRVWFECHDLRQLGSRDGEHLAISTLAEHGAWGATSATAAGEIEVFAASGDPAGDRDLTGERRELDARYRDLHRRWLDAAKDAKQLRNELTPGEREQLKQLGYLAE